MDGEELAAVYCNVSYADVVDAVLQRTISLYDSTFSRAVWRPYGGAEGLVVWYQVLQLTMASRLSTAALALLPRCALPRDHGSFAEDHGPRWPEASGWPQGPSQLTHLWRLSVGVVHTWYVNIPGILGQ